MIDLIKQRRSIRQYTNQPVTDEQVRLLLEAAMAAPSGSALDPWHFIVVRNAETRAKLAATHTFSDMCSRAPIVIAICGDEKLSPHWIADCAAATAALSISGPPSACTVIIATPRSVAARTAFATVFGMSWNFRSRKTSPPRSRI